MNADPFAGLEPELECELADIASAEMKPKVNVEQVLTTSGLGFCTETSSVDDIAAALRLLASATQDVDALFLAAVREASIKKLQAIGTRSPAAMIDAALSLYRAETGSNGIGIAIAEVMPWPEAVDGRQLLEDIASVFCRYMVLSSIDATAIALWTVLTYLRDAVWILPLLVITSPEKRCGKTLLLELLQHLVCRPLPASNISAASLYRVVEGCSPTLLIDEADTFLGDNDELRGIINSGHRRSNAFVIRCDGDNQEPRQFSTWCPKAIALIGKLADTLEDRAVRIELRRKMVSDSIERLRSDRIGAELDPLRRKTARWAKDHSEAVKNCDPVVSDELNDRAADNWRPLLAIAGLAGGHWPSLAQEASETLTQGHDDSNRVQLLQDVHRIILDQGVDRLHSDDLVRALSVMEERPWPEWSKGKPITQRQVARLLKPFGIQPRQIKINLINNRGYLLEDMKDALSRYGDNSSTTPLLTNNNAGLSGFSSATGKNGVAHEE